VLPGGGSSSVWSVFLQHQTSRCSDTPVSYSGGPGLKSEVEDRLTEIFRGIPRFGLADAGGRTKFVFIS
jgi:hypothetical protein